MKNDVNIDNPIFVMGTGRSGLSPIMDLLAYHKAFAWPSQFNSRHPKNFKWSYLSRLVDLPFINSSRLKYRRFPIHVEAFPMWNNLFFGFRRPFRDLTADDVTPLVRSKFRDAVHKMMKYQGKPRFIAEYSGWSRIGFLKAIFPEAQFIHIVRDGRAVANSLTHVGWWAGWEGIYKWRWGQPDQELLEKWEHYDHSFLALAGIHWKILINNIVEQSNLLSADELLVVRYEDLVEEPFKEAYRCIEFCGLDPDCPRYTKHLQTVKIVNANQQKFRIPAWQGNMTKKQIDMLNDLLEKELVLFDYLQHSTDNTQQNVVPRRVSNVVVSP